MPVKKEASGRRSVQTEVEVPGTPEQVWKAISTGPGVSSWFVPTQIDERDGGAVTSSFGPGMDAVATITSWEPPHRFTADSRGEMGPTGPTIATEWTVEARAGGTCVVRVVHSWFASTDDWDSQFEGHEHGWTAFFRILRMYLTHFRGQAGAAFQVMGVGPEPVATAWDTLTRGLGLSGAAEGQTVKSAPGAPVFAGIVERAGPPEYPELLVRLREPAPGLAHVFAMPMGGSVYLPIRLYLYGDGAAAAAAQAEPAWTAWLSEHFPAPESATASGQESH